MRFIAFLIFTAFCSSYLLAEQTILKGKISGFDGKIIKLGYYSDYFTFTKEELAKASIQNGAFQLNVELGETRQLYLQLEDKKTALFAVPGKEYILSLKYNEAENRGRAYDKLLDISITNEGSNGLNSKIKVFNSAYQDFFSKHYRAFIINEAQEEISNFIKSNSSNPSYQKPSYLKNYVRYALANLRDINKENKKKLAQEYLIDNPVLFQHKEYINFFQQLYQKDFEMLLLKKEGVPIKRAIMLDKDLPTALELIAAEKGFKNKELSELYLMKGLYDTFHESIIEEESNLEFLKKLSKDASTANNRQLAKNIIEAISIYQKGAAAPSFSLKDSKGNTKTLADYKGKIVYLNFWAKWSIPSLREMKLMEKLHEKYQDDVHFVSINLDEDPKVNNSEKEKNGYKWDMLYGGEDFELREKYEVKTVPLYYLIDAEGNMEEIFAPNPVQMDKVFYNRFK